MPTYRCTFTFKDNSQTVYSNEGIDSFKDGFWITGTVEFTKGGDCEYWIPPSAIKYVHKTGGR
jgi:hypothetical protein